MTVPPNNIPPLPKGVPAIVPPASIVITYGEVEDGFLPEYCELAIKCLGTGRSALSFANRLGVTPATLVKWQRTYPEFAEAMQKAQAASAAYWEGALIQAQQNGLPTTGIIFALKNVAPEHWRDKQEIETRNYNLNVELTRDDRIKSIEGKLARIIEHDETETVS